MTKEDLDAHIVGVVLQQFDVKKDVELFGDRADMSVQKELQQIHNLETYQPMMESDQA